jgi:hypothetical protein
MVLGLAALSKQVVGHSGVRFLSQTAYQKVLPYHIDYHLDFLCTQVKHKTMLGPRCNYYRVALSRKGLSLSGMPDSPLVDKHFLV